MTCNQGCSKRERARRLPNSRKSWMSHWMSAFPDSQCPGGGDFRSNVVFSVTVLRLSQLLQFPQFPNSLGPSSPSCPPGFSSFWTLSPSDPLRPPPMRPAQAAVCSELLPLGSPQRAPLAARTRAPTWRLRSGSGHPQAGALQTGAHGPCALTGSRRLGTGAEGKQGLRPDLAIGGGGGGESGREGGGRAGAGERVSERARPALPVTHRALCLHPLPCAPFSPEPAAPPTSPAAAFNPCGLGWRRGPTRREKGGGREGWLTRPFPSFSLLLSPHHSLSWEFSPCSETVPIPWTSSRELVRSGGGHGSDPG